MPKQNQKIAIVQRGPAKSGKSTTIRMFYQKLCKTFPNGQESHRARGNKDLRLVYSVGNKKVGIESMGDPSHQRQKVSLQLFVDLGCIAIICASRTRGATSELVDDLAHDGYTIFKRLRSRVADDKQEKSNRQEAEWMLNEVRKLLDPA